MIDKVGLGISCLYGVFGGDIDHLAMAVSGKVSVMQILVFEMVLRMPSKWRATCNIVSKYANESG